MKIKTLGFQLKLSACGSTYDFNCIEDLAVKMNEENKNGNGFFMYGVFSFDGVETKLPLHVHDTIKLKGFN